MFSLLHEKGISVSTDSFEISLLLKLNFFSGKEPCKNDDVFIVLLPVTGEVTSVLCILFTYIFCMLHFSLSVQKILKIIYEFEYKYFGYLGFRLNKLPTNILH